MDFNQVWLDDHEPTVLDYDYELFTEGTCAYHWAGTKGMQDPEPQ